MKLLLKLKELKNNKRKYISPMMTPIHILRYIVLHLSNVTHKLILFLSELSELFSNFL